MFDLVLRKSGEFGWTVTVTTVPTYLSLQSIKFAVSEVYDLPAWGNCGLYVPSPVNQTAMYEYMYISNTPFSQKGDTGHIRIRIRNSSTRRACVEGIPLLRLFF